jgi:hypothetical protein
LTPALAGAALATHAGLAPGIDRSMALDSTTLTATPAAEDSLLQTT